MWKLLEYLFGGERPLVISQERLNTTLRQERERKLALSGDDNQAYRDKVKRRMKEGFIGDSLYQREPFEKRSAKIIELRRRS